MNTTAKSLNYVLSDYSYCMLLPFDLLNAVIEPRSVDYREPQFDASFLNFHVTLLDFYCLLNALFKNQ